MIRINTLNRCGETLTIELQGVVIQRLAAVECAETFGGTSQASEGRI